MEWQPIETAPKDREIVIWNAPEGSDPTCGYCDCSTDETRNETRICLYHAHAEGLAAGEEGMQIAVWGGGWSDGYEDGGGCMPDWWFQKGSEFEVVLNPTHWLDVEPPQ